MIGHRAGDRGHRLDHIQPVHSLFVLARVRLRLDVLILLARRNVLANTATGGEVLAVADVAGAAAEEVRVERNHDIRLGEIVRHVHIAAEGLAGTGGNAVLTARLVLGPLRFRKLRQQFIELRSQRRRRHRPGKQAEFLALVAALPDAIQFLADIVPDILVRRRRTAACRGLRAIRIVEIEDGGLRDDAGGPQAGRVIGVALDLGRPAFIAANDHAGHVTAHRAGGGEVKRDTGGKLIGLVRVRNDLPHRGGTRRATGGTGERQRRPH